MVHYVQELVTGQSVIKDVQEVIPKPPCTIQIYFEDYGHLESSSVNQILRNYNEFINLTFRNKTQRFDVLRIQKLAKLFGITMTLQDIYDHEFNPKR